MARSWDIFCRVVDNYGDAAVCWRLARQLSLEHRGTVRLWIDELQALQSLCPDVGVALDCQTVETVEIRRWVPGANFGAAADIAVEAFGCGLPQSYVDAMVARDRRPVWIVLEYLSAEPWVVSHHRLPSPHPRLPLDRWFFFPGFVPGTGGVLREATLEPRRLAFVKDPDAGKRFWHKLGFSAPKAGALAVSFFGYENPAVRDLLQAWAEGGREIVVAVPRGRLRGDVCEFFGADDPADGTVLSKGRLEARFIPFLPQAVYDEFLWACDWNFVRGEDSVVRGQWAARPFTWQIYPQAERAHDAKLASFLDCYCAGMDPGLEAPLRRFWSGWNGASKGTGTIGEDWEALAARIAELQAHAEMWARKLALPGELAANLAHYCEERLK